MKEQDNFLQGVHVVVGVESRKPLKKFTIPYGCLAGMGTALPLFLPTENPEAKLHNTIQVNRSSFKRVDHDCRTATIRNNTGHMFSSDPI
jgi:hypothetical protein